MAVWRYQSMFMDWKFDNGGSRNRVRQAEASTQIFEHAAEAVKNADHAGPGLHNALKIVPFTDETIGAIAGFN